MIFVPIINKLMSQGKSIVFVKVDNGPDWNLASLVNAYFFFKLWEKTKLDILLICSYAALWSAYNNIEHLWSLLSRLLSGVILPAVAPGDEKPPCQMSISKEERRGKEAAVMDAAMSEIALNYWKKAKFNGFEVSTIPLASLAEETPFSNYANVHKLLTGPLRDLRSTNELMAEMRSMLRHMEKESNEIIFKKCQDKDCNHCSVNPVIATSFWDYMMKNAYIFSNLIESSFHPRHSLSLSWRILVT